LVDLGLRALREVFFLRAVRPRQDGRRDDRHNGAVEINATKRAKKAR
jgi:hypothetical protein